jgi:hypothetical protein
MGASIHVESLQPSEYRVRVAEGSSETFHIVTLHPDDHRRLAGTGHTPEALIRASFAFLLEREPKESILAKFALPAIARYFPEYEREIGHKLTAPCGDRSTK